MANDPTATAEAIIQKIFADFDTETLIDRARHSLRIPPTDVEKASKTVRITDPVEAALVNELIAQAAELQRVAKTATADIDAVKDLLTELLGEENEVLKVHNAEVFTAKYSESIVLNQSYVKSKFPQIEGNEDFYTVQTRRNRLFK